MDVREWWEVEVRIYGTERWRRTTVYVGGIDDGFETQGEATEFIEQMTKVGDILYEGASWRVVRCTREPMYAVTTR